MQAFDVRAVCTTDDPSDDLAAHRAIAADPSFPLVVAPAFRPDKAMAAADAAVYNAYLDRLGAVAGIDIGSYADLLSALERRHGYFHEQGCRLFRPWHRGDLRRSVHPRGGGRGVRQGARRHAVGAGRAAPAAVGAAV